MSGLIAGLAIGAARVEIAASAEFSGSRPEPGEKPAVQDLPVHQFPAKPGQRLAETEELSSVLARPDLVAPALPLPDAGRSTIPSFESHQEMEDRERARRIYRGRTVEMLRRYLRYSIEAGRLPSMLGSEFFRAKVTAYTVVTFEDRVIFVHDMERCLERLDEFSRQLIARHILQEHDRWATARLLHCNEKTVRRYTPVVLDMLSEILMEVGLMERSESIGKNSCQGGENDEIDASDCEDGEYKF
jgi:hypothetical protein